MTASRKRRRWFIVVASLVCLVGALTMMRSAPSARQDVAPTEVAPTTVPDSDGAPDNELPLTRKASIKEVMQLAEASKQQMGTGLHDYTAHFVQQERDDAGKLSERTEYLVKIQTRMRNEARDAPMRIYLKYLKPDASAGREVIWGADLYNGQMAVHDVSVLLSWKTIWLDPTGMIAMAGQKYPIYEIGLVRLVEQLIERGQRDLDNPNTSVTITRDHEFEGRPCDLIQVTHAEPSGEVDDFSLAEIVYDPELLLILSYRSFGWVENQGDEVPLLESYQYYDLKTNVGLSDQDFDVNNEAYGFP